MPVMREHYSRFESLTSPLKYLIALFPIAFGAYMAIALYDGFSKIDALSDARREKLAPKVVPLPGRPPQEPGVPPARTVVFEGGYAAIADWLRPLHLGPADESGAARGSREGYLGLGPKRTLAVQPIGDFTAAQRRIVGLEAELIAIAFGLPVRILAEIPVDDAWPSDALRPDERWGEDQLLTPYILEEILKPQRKGDVAAVFGVTARDLRSDDEWSYVLGETEPGDRVGVWSIFRNGDLAGDEDERREVLRASLATATREVGRMLGFHHASAFACNLRGGEKLSGEDRGPSWLCPDCEAALLAATGADPVWRYEKLIAFYRENDLGEEEWFYERALYAVSHLGGLASVYVPGCTRVYESPFCPNRGAFGSP